ncbi:uncharacterized protein LOC114527212 [Dendronephthya gigantea]|uniref:uncharacterized protein LOC114527212 n=1 Tax=Dendronephthya gigantea TaxID=151771 RepID=UPI0010699B82|nr:uncharacterized protein LOC114527212 [Dendronephthya gigantea]
MVLWVFPAFLVLAVSHLANGEVIWPYGTYGMPKPKTGCPDKNTWKEGWRQQDLEKETNTSSFIHMDVQLQGFGNINRSFCMKTVPDTGKTKWPRGFYCIYKQRNSFCPSGMIQGDVTWDDVNIFNVNKHGGTLPDGVYDSNTKIYSCCQNMGKWFESIELPIHRPFYLLPHNNFSTPRPRCQLVKWATSLMEYIDYDSVEIKPDAFNGNHVFLQTIRSKSGNQLLRVHYCYYEGCRYEINGNRGVFAGTINGSMQFDKCSWLIEVEKPQVISIKFSQLLLPECKESYLAVYDGSNEEAVLLAKYCGSRTETNMIVSSGNQLIIILKSLTPKEGFSRKPKFEVIYAQKTDTNFTLTTRPKMRPSQSATHSSNTTTDPDTKTSLILSLVFALTFVLIIVLLLVIFRAKITCVEKLCNKANEQTEEQTVEQNEHAVVIVPIYVNDINATEQNINENIYTELNVVNPEPENIYQPLKHNTREKETGTDQYMDGIYEDVN